MFVFFWVHFLFQSVFGQQRVEDFVQILYTVEGLKGMDTEQLVEGVGVFPEVKAQSRFIILLIEIQFVLGVTQLAVVLRRFGLLLLVLLLLGIF